MEHTIQEQHALSQVISKLLEAVLKRENLGKNQVVFHKEYYEVTSND